MKRRHLYTGLALCCLALFSACTRESSVWQQSSYVFGTQVQISIYGVEPKLAQAASAAVLADLDRLNNKLHAWRPSTLTNINHAFAMFAAA